MDTGDWNVNEHRSRRRHLRRGNSSVKLMMSLEEINEWRIPMASCSWTRRCKDGPLCRCENGALLTTHKCLTEMGFTRLQTVDVKDVAKQRIASLAWSIEPKAFLVDKAKRFPWFKPTKRFLRNRRPFIVFFDNWAAKGRLMKLLELNNDGHGWLENAGCGTGSGRGSLEILSPPKAGKETKRRSITCTNGLVIVDDDEQNERRVI
ncbi:hypothetical protein C8J56DRAFT_938292 [Mycena floridula]|nr:hypothetical protein C8J56DRAFT_938292 [Mycena floridula]